MADFTTADIRAMFIDPTPWANPDRARVDFDEWLAAHDAQVLRDAAAEAESVLNHWLLEDKGPSVFDRGLHLLGHLKLGGTLEQYGRPKEPGDE